MSRLFKAFAALALAQNGLKAEPFESPTGVVPIELKGVGPVGDPTCEWSGCSNTTSNDWCIFNWGPAHGYLPVPDAAVERECFEDEGCCPDSTSPTRFSDCLWDGCAGQEDAIHNSTAYCEQQVPQNVTECFEAKSCCPDARSPTRFSDCPYVLPEYAWFFIGEGVALGAGLVAQGIAYQKKLSNFIKGLGWVAIGSASSGLVASAGAYLAKDESAVAVSSISCLLIGAAVTSYWVYKKNHPSLQDSCCAEPNCQVELASSCCRIVCDCNFFRRRDLSQPSESKPFRGLINNDTLYDGLLDPPIQKIDLTS